MPATQTKQAVRPSRRGATSGTRRVPMLIVMITRRAAPPASTPAGTGSADTGKQRQGKARPARPRQAGRKSGTDR